MKGINLQMYFQNCDRRGKKTSSKGAKVVNGGTKFRKVARSGYNRWESLSARERGRSYAFRNQASGGGQKTNPRMDEMAGRRYGPENQKQKDCPPIGSEKGTSKREHRNGPVESGTCNRTPEAQVLTV